MADTCLVTGGAGFLGSHLSDFLLEKGCRVICVDNLDTGTLENLEHISKNDDFVFINHDLTKPIEISEDLDYISQQIKMNTLD